MTGSYMLYAIRYSLGSGFWNFEIFIDFRIIILWWYSSFKKYFYFQTSSVFIYIKQFLIHNLWINQLEIMINIVLCDYKMLNKSLFKFSFDITNWKPPPYYTTGFGSHICRKSGVREWWWALILSHDLGYSQRIPKKMKICLDNRSKHPSWVFALSTEDPWLLITSALLCYMLYSILLSLLHLWNSTQHCSDMIVPGILTTGIFYW